MNRLVKNVIYINKWHHFYNDYNITINNNKNLNWMKIIETNNTYIDDTSENDYLSQMAYMHSHSYLIGLGVKDIECSYDEEDNYLSNMSLLHSRCAKHS